MGGDESDSTLDLQAQMMIEDEEEEILLSRLKWASYVVL